MDWSYIWGFWWLIFPIGAAIGGAAKGFERASERRHRRRIEMLRTKAELQAAKAGAVSPPLRATEETSARSDDTPATQLQQLFDAHDDTTRRWLDYELDVAKLIAFPAMSDGRQPLTAGFLRAKRVADRLRPATATTRVTPEQLKEYRDAVTEYEVAFDLAERDARRLKNSTFTPEERKRLDTAQQLLSVAVDEAATPAERQLAYRRVREELDGLLSLSDDAIDILEKKVAQELPARPSATPPPPQPA